MQNKDGSSKGGGKNVHGKEGTESITVEDYAGDSCIYAITDLKALIVNNLLVNMAGKLDGWKELDLLQEHMDYWIKSVYKAHGSNSTWEWLAMISTCVIALRDTVRAINKACGVVQTTAHTTPSLHNDISKLMVSLANNSVHDHQGPPHSFSSEGSRAKGFLTEEYNELKNPCLIPLRAFNSHLSKRTRANRPSFDATPSGTSMEGETQGEAGRIISLCTCKGTAVVHNLGV
ncbi:hypothetical protein BOTBODRAFT_50953 [Botryobasidium botryosum FD-172 SS1]|uniref:DUF6589 domain-containing protein n=1 Tax=Botryobasidium botryosum (strain FD-172 SS1) TaxID=930990 RepID=A0A067MZ87_BOTB1|nr:hypothetical protein BOTBODRAFT_50953 [Botryobasidium botryosum FD-172 SS1]